MRNSTMKDKLSEVLLLERDAVAAMRSGQADSKEAFIQTAQRARQSKDIVEEYSPKGSRYVVPPKRSNPFSVRAYSQAPFVPEPKPVQRQLEPSHESAVAVMDEPPPTVAEPAAEPVSDVQNHSPDYLIPPKTFDPVCDGKEDVIDAEFPEADKQAEAPESQSAAHSQNTSPPGKEAPVVFTPPNLSWLDQRTPFEDHLRGIVDACRVAKSKVSFTIEQSQLRQKELREQIKTLSERLEKEEYGTLQQQDHLRQIDDTISACALVAEQSATIEPALLMAFGNQAKHKPKKTAESTAESTAETQSSTEAIARRSNSGTRRWAMGDESMCRRADVIRFFENNKGTNWSAPEIIKVLPHEKRAHAKKYLNLVLATLATEGKLVRLTTGIYRSAM